MERPLSAYVVFTGILSIVTIYLASQDMGTPAGCTSNMLYILMAFSVINIAFAIYMQWKVWKTIMSDENREKFIDGDNPTESYTGQFGAAAVGMLARADPNAAKKAQEKVPTATAVPADPGKIIVPKEVVQQSFQKVFLEDLVVLAMFFLLIAVAVLSWKGQDFVDTADKKCEVSDTTMNCGISFFFLAFCFAFAYRCCSCCSNKVSIAKPTHEDELYDAPGASAQGP
jgi:hypothetical protein